VPDLPVAIEDFVWGSAGRLAVENDIQQERTEPHRDRELSAADVVKGKQMAAACANE